MSVTRVRAILSKELRDYRRNRSVVVAMVIVPLVFAAPPLINIFALPEASAGLVSRGDILVYLLGIPAIVPAALSAYAIVGEREQGTLEPLLITPITREELLLGKALAVFVPSLAVSYLIYGLMVGCILLFANPAVATALLRPEGIAAQVLFTPLVTGWSIWVGVGVSARSREVRVAQQVATLASLPAVAVVALIAYDVIHADLGTTIGFAALLIVLNVVGLRVAAAAFDRERLVSGTRS